MFLISSEGAHNPGELCKYNPNPKTNKQTNALIKNHNLLSKKTKDFFSYRLLAMASKSASAVINKKK